MVAGLFGGEIAPSWERATDIVRDSKEVDRAKIIYTIDCSVVRTRQSAYLVSTECRVSSENGEATCSHNTPEYRNCSSGYLCWLIMFECIGWFT